MADLNDSAIPDGAWPEYQVPSGVHVDTAPAGAPAPSGTPAPDPATPPASADQPPAQPAAALPPAAPTGGGPGQPDDASESVPRYRLNEQREQFERIIAAQTEQITRLTTLMESALRGRPAETPGPAAPPPEPPSPQDLAIRERLLKVIPELAMLEQLKPLAERSAQLLGAADAVPAWQQAESAFWDRYAESAVGTVYDKVAVLTLGEGKRGTDLDDFVRDGLLNTFTKWVARDPKRAARFEAQDPKVVDEFVAAYKTSVYDPVRRDRNAELLTRAQHPPALPVAGGGAPPAPSTPPALNYDDEDAVHAAAWARRDTVGA